MGANVEEPGSETYDKEKASMDSQQTADSGLGGDMNTEQPPSPQPAQASSQEPQMQQANKPATKKI